MSSCTPQVFPDFKDAHWKKLVRKAAARGVDPPAPCGTYSQAGFSLSWNYLAAQETLHVHCVGKPFFVPSDLVMEKIRKFVAGCMA